MGYYNDYGDYTYDDPYYDEESEMSKTYIPNAGEKFYVAVVVNQYGPTFVQNNAGYFHCYKTEEEAIKVAQQWINRNKLAAVVHIMETTAYAEKKPVPVEVTIVK